MNTFFNRWQRLYIGRMLTFLLFVVTGVVFCWLLQELVKAISFLQPVLIPLAVAAVVAFLLEPLVRAICAKTQWSRTRVVLLMMATLVLVFAGLGIWLVPRAYASAGHMYKDIPAFLQKAEQRFFALADSAQHRIDGINKKLPPTPMLGPAKVAPEGGGKPVPIESEQPAASASPEASASPSPAAGGQPEASPKPGENSGGGNTLDVNHDGKVDSSDLRQWVSTQLPQYEKQIPQLLQKTSQILFKAFGGFLGVFGVLLNAIIIPIYIFFLLTEAREISKSWADYLPLKDSKFKQEIVSTLGEIHTYLVAFFRGQLVVSAIDSVLITTCLWLFLDLNFSVLIGVLVLFLTFIPYLGILICYVPAVLIAVVQFGDWQHPAAVIVIMFIVQTLESTVIAPKIVGESTGLHPLTVIISVFAWELILDGPIGALLAVPLTAALKVIMRRYVWERAQARSRILPAADVQPVLRAGDRDRFGDDNPDVQAVSEAAAQPPAENVHSPSDAKGQEIQSPTKPLREFTGATYQDFLDFRVVDREGQEVGTLFSAWSDQSTGAFEYLGVKTGFLMGKNHIVPAGEAEVDLAAHTIHVPYDLDFLKGAPVCDATEEVTEEHKNEIKAYYAKNGQ